MVIEKLLLYGDLIRIQKPIGILLLLWPAMWALWIAGQGQPPLWIVLIFILGTVLMRSAGCAINDYADRDFDGHIKRTKDRPLATGKITPQEAIMVFAILALMAFILVLFLNQKTILLSFVAIALAVLYPFMKRFTHMPQLVLGIAFGWAVPMAFTAVQNTVPFLAWVLFAATVIWALIYDSLYAMVDRKEDLKIGIKSTAILFGKYDRLIIGLFQILMVVLLIWVGRLGQLGWFYWTGVVAGAGFFIWQQWLIKDRNPTHCFTAFLNNNWVGMALFFGILGSYLL